MENIVDTTDFSGENNCSSRSFDDFSMIRIKQNLAREIRPCDTPKLNYLNLLDYKDKNSNFYSSIFRYTELDAKLGKSKSFEKSFEIFEKYTSASIFRFYISYLKNIPKDSIDLEAFDKRICHVVKNLEHCGEPMISAIIDEIIYSYSVSPKEKILLPIILKHLCTTDELITYSAEYFFAICNARFFKEVLDACIDSRFNLWTMWERNFILNNISFCPVTMAYFYERLEFLRVLLDYGLQQTDHKVSTLEFLLDEYYVIEDFPWLGEFILEYSQRPRSTVVLEVFLLIEIFLDLSRRPAVLASCFQLVWDARKEPYITKMELLQAFEDYTGFRITGVTRNELNTLMLSFMRRLDDLQTLLPHYQEVVPQPRSLLHLCRCTVREALKKNMEMPRGVAKLPIAEKMKSYILLK